MSPNEISRSSLLDLLFEHRNKQYGAYELRKQYDNRLGLSIGITMGAVLLALFLMNFLSGNADSNNTKQVITDVILQQVVPDAEPLPGEPPKAKPASTPVASIQSTNNIVLTPNENTVPDQGSLKDKAIGTTTVDILTSGGPDIFTTPDPGPPVTAPVPAPVEPAPEAEPPSAPPSFPGGMKAWTDFLVRNLMPSSDMQPGERRSVLVRFWVDENGAVGRFEIQQSGGNAFDNEVLRVLRKMPRWKPALQLGRAVATSFVQPVTFQAPDE